MFGAPPDRSRPSHWRTTAFGIFQFASSGTPGLLVNANATCTSTLGTMYEPAEVNRVVMPGSMWQYGFAGLYGMPPALAAPLALEHLDDRGLEALQLSHRVKRLFDLRATGPLCPSQLGI